MASKLQFYAQLAENTAKRISGSREEWTAFLRTAARLYKYPYEEQLLIYAQRPDATACAEYDLWNDTMGRYVRRGPKGIALIDNSGANAKLRYVFDVADTGGRRRSRTVNLWEYRQEHQETVSELLERSYDAEPSGDIAAQMEEAAIQLAGEYWTEHQREILENVPGSYLEEYDEYNIGVAFRSAAAVSITYTLMSRCGLDPDSFFQHENFLNVFDFNTPALTEQLGKAVSQISQDVLRQIEVSIKKYERDSAERTDERGRTDVPLGGRLPDPGSGSERGGEGSPADRNLGGAPEALSEGESAAGVHGTDFEREAVSAPGGDRQSGTGAHGSADAGAGESSGRDGGSEDGRHVQVGRDHEQLQGAGGGDHLQRPDLRLISSPAEESSGQFSLFPSEAEQIQRIDEAEGAQSSAFTVSQAEIDHILRLGSNTANARMKIVTEYSKHDKDYSGILRSIFHGGYGIETDEGPLAAWYEADGIHLIRGRDARYIINAQVISWEDAGGTALLEAMKEVKGYDPIPIGTYRGFDLSMTLENFGQQYVMTVNGKITTRVMLGNDARGNLIRIDNALNGIQNRLAEVEQRLKNVYAQMESAKEELGKPFPQEEELKAKAARLAELNVALNIDGQGQAEPIADAEETAEDHSDQEKAPPKVEPSSTPQLDPDEIAAACRSMCQSEPETQKDFEPEE